MWKLTIEDDEGKQTSIPLGHDEYGIGRDKANTIRLTDRNVSRRHAKLRKDVEGWHVFDCDSYNGTYVNGVRVQGEQALSNGDVVQLGDYRLELLDDSLAATGEAQTPAPPAHLRPNRLVVVVGPNPGAEFPLDREHITLGRAEEAIISVNHSSVSRLHAELIALGGGRYEIIDKNSANGIRVNGVELKRGILEAGDALELGDVRLRFVGAGKIFRAADHTQQLAAVGPLEGVSSKAGQPAKRKGLGTAIGLTIAICLVGAAVAVFAMRGSKNPAPPRSGANETAAPRSSEVADVGELVRIAKHLMEIDKNLEAAHQTLQDVPDDSPVRDEADFKAIEAAWAESMFAKVDETKDPKEKRALLYKIAGASTVSADSRKKAADMIQELDKTLPPDPNRPALTFVTSQAPAPSKPSESSAPSNDAFDPANVKKQLEQKVFGGRGTIAEIRMLKAACSQLRDYACRDRAAAMLKAKMGDAP